MAKKKNKRKSKAQAVPKEPNLFLRQVAAVFLFLLAICLIFGGFGMGGALPTTLFGWMYSLFGWVAYLTPIALIYFGIHKLSSEDNRLPFNRLLSMLCWLMATSAWLYVALAERNEANTAWQGDTGGIIGRFFGGLVFSIFDQVPASFILFALVLLTASWTFGYSPKNYLKPFKFLFRKRSKDTDLEDLKENSVHEDYKLNAGVPVEHIPKTSQPAPQKAAPAAKVATALTIASDPDWQFPPISLLNQKQDKADPGDIKENVQIVKDTFANFGIDVETEDVNVGPRVTQYTLKPPSGIKLSKITALEDNLKLDLAAKSIRMEAPIPGKRAVGIEVPNIKSATVRLASIFGTGDWENQKAYLPFAVGRDITGTPVVADLAEMPHLLVAGQTKAGKSVFINTFLTSLVYKNSPSDLKLILVDPKHVELLPYDEIPHLLTPVITEPEKCISALKWAVAEMERRYRTMANAKKRNIYEYNEGAETEGMPFIVIVIDELADLMMMAAKDVEALIVRIAQKARAVGIHLVLATQRPSVDIITGLIKANMPARIAFAVASQIDSRTIIDHAGAEKLLGAGDMLFKTPDMTKPKRVQSPLINTEETQKVTDFLRMQRAPQYDDDVVSQPVHIGAKGGVVADYVGDDDDDMWEDAVRVVVDNRKASTSLLQRRLKIGYGRAARLIDRMEEQGVISSADGHKPREVLISSYDEILGDDSEEISSDEVYADMTDEEPGEV